MSTEGYCDEAHPHAPAAAEETQSTEPNTQETQPVSQHNPIVEENMWGILIPCNPVLNRIDFRKVKKVYRIGRNTHHGQGGNDIIFPGNRISNYHCTIEWDCDGPDSAVKVTDTSRNGTFINKKLIGFNKSMLLDEGEEIAFGTYRPQFGDAAEEDYRFVFHKTTVAPKGISKHYQVHSYLGTGSYASVWKALHRDTGKWYAVKWLRCKEPYKVETAFAREIRILETLDHPRICQFKEVFYEESSIKLVLEYVAGGDLLSYIERQHAKLLTEGMTQHLTYQICDAIKYIHSRSIAHRDLKPENLLLTPDDPPMIKVADFGLAKAVDSMTRLRTMCGTPEYVAPEVILREGLEGYDHLVDSWSIGVIVYGMLTGRSPFPGPEDQPLAQYVRTRTVDWFTLQYLVSNDAALDFVQRLLEHDPCHRMPPSSALEHYWLADFKHLDSGIGRENVPPVDLEYSQSQLQASQKAYDNSDARPTAPSAAPARSIDSLSPEASQSQPRSSQIPGLTGALPQSQRLQRRSDILAQSQSRQDEGIIVPGCESIGEERRSESDAVRSDGSVCATKKRKTVDMEELAIPEEAAEECGGDTVPIARVPETTRAGNAHRTRRGAPAAGQSSSRPGRAAARGGALNGAAGTTAAVGGVRRSERLREMPVKRRKL